MSNLCLEPLNPKMEPMSLYVQPVSGTVMWNLETFLWNLYPEPWYLKMEPFLWTVFLPTFTKPNLWPHRRQEGRGQWASWPGWPSTVSLEVVPLLRCEGKPRSHPSGKLCWARDPSVKGACQEVALPNTAHAHQIELAEVVWWARASIHPLSSPQRGKVALHPNHQLWGRPTSALPRAMQP